MRSNIPLPVRPGEIAWAQRYRERRRERANVFPVRPHDLQWTGDCVELLMYRALGRHVPDVHWRVAEPGAVADYRLGRSLVELKNSCRAVLRPDDVGCLPLYKAQRPYDFFLFTSYVTSEARFYLHGAIARAVMWDVGRVVPCGTRVNPRFVARCDTLVVPYLALEHPTVWLAHVAEQNAWRGVA